MSTFTDIAVKVFVISVVLSLLPVSPFVGFSYLLESVPYVSILNFFLPISEILVLLESWLVVVAVYYGILYMANYAGILKS